MRAASGAGKATAVSSGLLIAGALLLLIGTFLHPSHEDPNDPVRAFAEYAADRTWLLSHMVQLGGVAAMIAGLLIVMRGLSTGGGQACAALASAFGIASLATAAALQAVDGIALKAVVDAWSMAEDGAKQSLFDVAFAVRQIEIGFAAMVGGLLGMTILLGSAALYSAGRFTRWLPAIGIVGGLGMLLGGVVVASTGFSPMARGINMLSSLLLLTWIALLAVVDYRATRR